MNTTGKGWAALAVVLALSVFCLGGYWLYRTGARAYTRASLAWARGNGVFETPQQGVLALAEREYCDIERVEIEQAATNSFDGSEPHVWFVLYTVYASHHQPCGPGRQGAAMYHQTFERGGVYYLNVKDGWVWMPEGRFPEFIGYWMKEMDLAGPGDPTHVPRN